MLIFCLLCCESLSVCVFFWILNLLERRFKCHFDHENHREKDERRRTHMHTQHFHKWKTIALGVRIDSSEPHIWLKDSHSIERINRIEAVIRCVCASEVSTWHTQLWDDTVTAPHSVAQASYINDWIEMTTSEAFESFFCSSLSLCRVRSIS